MSRSRTAFLCTPLIILFAGLFQSAAAQGPSVAPERSYEVSLQVLIGTNDRLPAAAVPQNLSAIVRDLKPRFSFENYRLTNTYLGRIGTSGSLEYKSVTSITGQDSESDSPSFLEWSIGRLLESPDTGTRTSIQVEPFRFGARVPIKMGAPNVVYESIGLNVNKLRFPENVPTLVGTLNLPKAAGTLFLVVTAKHVNE